MTSLGSEKFFLYWKKSFLFHCVIISVLAISWKFNFWKYFDLSPEIITPSVRVDIVELPKYTLEELKKMEITPPPENIEPSKQAEIKEIKIEKKIENEDSKIEELFKKIEKNVAKKRKIDQKHEKDLKSMESRRQELNQILLAGNKLKKGSVTEGEEQKNETNEFDQYLLEVTEKIRVHWKLPSYLQQSAFKCRIQLFINSQGTIELIKIVETSGNSEFDDWALKAINDTIPFKVPLSQIVPDLMRGKFILGFPL